MASHPVSSQPSASGRNSDSGKRNDNSRRDSVASSNPDVDGASEISEEQKRKCICCCCERRRLRRRCCCVCKDETDPDEWNYPWNKSIPKCLGLCCMWYGFCLVFPCSLCIPRYSHLLCCVREGCWDGTCCGACLFGLPPPGSKPRRHGGRPGSRVSHWSDSS